MWARHGQELSTDKESFNSLGVCRLCMLKGCSHMESIFRVSHASCIADKIASVTQLTLSEDDGLPTTACQQCLFQLDVANAFIERCTQSDSSFRSMLEPLEAPENEIIETVQGEPANLRLEEMVEQDPNEEFFQDDDQPFKIEIQEFPPNYEELFYEECRDQQQKSLENAQNVEDNISIKIEVQFDEFIYEDNSTQYHCDSSVVYEDKEVPHPEFNQLALDTEENQLAPDTEDNQLAQDTEENQLAPNSEDNQLAPDSEGNQLAQDTEENQLAPDTEENQLALDTEENQLAPDSEDNQLAQDTEENQLAPDSEDNQLAQDTEDNQLAPDTEENQLAPDSEGNQLTRDSEGNQLAPDTEVRHRCSEVLSEFPSAPVLASHFEHKHVRKENKRKRAEDCSISSTNGQGVVIPSQSTAKAFECAVCSVAFSTAVGLASHSRRAKRHKKDKFKNLFCRKESQGKMEPAEMDFPEQREPDEDGHVASKRKQNPNSKDLVKKLTEGFVRETQNVEPSALSKSNQSVAAKKIKSPNHAIENSTSKKLSRYACHGKVRTDVSKHPLPLGIPGTKLARQQPSSECSERAALDFQLQGKSRDSDLLPSFQVGGIVDNSTAGNFLKVSESERALKQSKSGNSRLVEKSSSDSHVGKLEVPAKSKRFLSGLKTFRCAACSLDFPSALSINQHFRRAKVHKNEKKVGRNLCRREKSLAKVAKLALSRSEMEGTEKLEPDVDGSPCSQVVPIIKIPVSEKQLLQSSPSNKDLVVNKFKCAICLLEFSTSQKLARHVWHTKGHKDISQRSRRIGISGAKLVSQRELSGSGLDVVSGLELQDKGHDSNLPATFKVAGLTESTDLEESTGHETSHRQDSDESFSAIFKDQQQKKLKMQSKVMPFTKPAGRYRCAFCTLEFLSSLTLARHVLHSKDHRRNNNEPKPLISSDEVKSDSLKQITGRSRLVAGLLPFEERGSDTSVPHLEESRINDQSILDLAPTIEKGGQFKFQINGKSSCHSDGVIAHPQEHNAGNYSLSHDNTKDKQEVEPLTKFDISPLLLSSKKFTSALGAGKISSSSLNPLTGYSKFRKKVGILSKNLRDRVDISKSDREYLRQESVDVQIQIQQVEFPDNLHLIGKNCDEVNKGRPVISDIEAEGNIFHPATEISCALDSPPKSLSVPSLELRTNQVPTKSRNGAKAIDDTQRQDKDFSKTSISNTGEGAIIISKPKGNKIKVPSEIESAIVSSGELSVIKQLPRCLQPNQTKVKLNLKQKELASYRKEQRADATSQSVANDLHPCKEEEILSICELQNCDESLQDILNRKLIVKLNRLVTLSDKKKDVKFDCKHTTGNSPRLTNTKETDCQRSETSTSQLQSTSGLDRNHAHSTLNADVDRSFAVKNKIDKTMEILPLAEETLSISTRAKEMQMPNL